MQKQNREQINPANYRYCKLWHRGSNESVESETMSFFMHNDEDDDMLDAGDCDYALGEIVESDGRKSSSCHQGLR
jgi:hypothetical protein